jgi:NAD(P)-dependent dehydrogenase (short-subunit alcohol dehydrogenase family)
VSGALDGRVAIVTEGGTGIGRATAELLAAAGARVLVTGRRREPRAATAALHSSIAPFVADVSREDDAATTVADALARWGRIDIVVNNAGAFAARPLAEIDAAPVRHLFDTNVLGPTLLLRAALPHLTSSRGAVVNVSSTFGHRAAAWIAHYAASKAALEHLTRCWVLALAPHGVRVNTVAPGPTNTPILERAGLPPETIEQVKRDEVARIPLGRRGEPIDVARWIVALAHPDATWISGQVLAVDGGLSVT